MQESQFVDVEEDTPTSSSNLVTSEKDVEKVEGTEKIDILQDISEGCKARIEQIIRRDGGDGKDKQKRKTELVSAIMKEKGRGGWFLSQRRPNRVSKIT